MSGIFYEGKKLGLEDPRNYLFLEYLRIVEEVQPEVFVIENVKTLLSTAGGWFKDEILAYIERLGYNVSYGILNAKDLEFLSQENELFLFALKVKKSNCRKEMMK